MKSEVVCAVALLMLVGCAVEATIADPTVEAEMAAPEADAPAPDPTTATATATARPPVSDPLGVAPPVDAGATSDATVDAAPVDVEPDAGQEPVPADADAGPTLAEIGTNALVGYCNWMYQCNYFTGVAACRAALGPWSCTEADARVCIQYLSTRLIRGDYGCPSSPPGVPIGCQPCAS